MKKKVLEGPRIIKRYRNRKLYDTMESCYVTLEDIAELVREGIDLQVIDNNTQEDLTSVSLAQIILEEEKKRKETLPLSTFTGLIRSGGETIRDFVQKSLGSGFKDVNIVREEIQHNIEKVLSMGSFSHEEGVKILNGIKGFIEGKIKPTVANFQNIPSVRHEVQSLREKLDALEKKLSTTKKKKR